VEQYARTAIINRFDDAYWAATICCSRDYARAYSYHCRARLHNVECGAPLSKEMALRIVRKFPGVTLDWLFLGRTEGLTAEMARALSEPSKGNDAGGDSQSSLASYLVTVQRREG
jgi:hypothetical protein